MILSDLAIENAEINKSERVSLFWSSQSLGNKMKVIKHVNINTVAYFQLMLCDLKKVKQSDGYVSSEYLKKMYLRE